MCSRYQNDFISHVSIRRHYSDRYLVSGSRVLVAGHEESSELLGSKYYGFVYQASCICGNGMKHREFPKNELTTVTSSSQLVKYKNSKYLC